MKLTLDEGAEIIRQVTDDCSRRRCTLAGSDIQSRLLPEVQQRLGTDWDERRGLDVGSPSHRKNGELYKMTPLTERGTKQ